MTDKKVVYFFGCLKGIDESHTEAGHYWRSSNGTETRDLKQPFGRYPDGSLAPEGPQVQGAAVLHQKDGWTAIGFWDRTGDDRGNSNSNFIVQGTFSYDEMVAMAQEAYPLIWKRVGRSVTHHSTNAPDIQGFIIERVDDEHVEIKLHGHHVYSLSHDSDGWDGIGTAEVIVGNIAGILGIQVRKR